MDKLGVIVERFRPSDMRLWHSTVKLIYIKTTLGTTRCGPYTQVVLIYEFKNRESIPRGSVKCGLYKQLVFIYRWSLERARLYNVIKMCKYEMKCVKIS